jgi:hypothetical protein
MPALASQNSAAAHENWRMKMAHFLCKRSFPQLIKPIRRTFGLITILPSRILQNFDELSKENSKEVLSWSTKLINHRQRGQE